MIRRAEPRDAPAITAIWNAVIVESAATFTSVEKTEAEITTLIAQHPVWVSDTAQGFALYSPFRSGPGYGATMEVTVHLASQARGQGLGRQLLTTLEAHASAAQIHSLIAAISGENAPAIAFHRALGFGQVGQLAQVGRKFGRWHDLILMQKFL